MNCKHSVTVAFQGLDLVLSYFPVFVAKTVSVSYPNPRLYVVKSLAEFVGPDEEDCQIC